MDKKNVKTLRKTPKKSSPTKRTVLDLKEELLKWICERHATNGPLDRHILRKKAIDLASSIGVTGFKCSESWLTLFLKKHGFSPSLTNCSGPIFPDYRVWIDLLRSLITQYRHKDLFNVDELVMYSDFVPGRTISNSPNPRKRSSEVSKNKEILLSGSQTNRIGMLMCCNSSGTEKLRPLITGPYKSCGSRNDCRYHRDAGSHIPDNVFADWLKKLNQDMAKSNRKILLLLNRDRICASQKATQLSHINLLYFPKDFPTQLRPLRGDVFHCVKMAYRRRYVQHIRSPDAKKKWGANEIVGNIVKAWKSVTQELIVTSFQRSKIRKDESSLKIECSAWDDLKTGISFKRFVTFDDELSEHAAQSPEYLEAMARGNNRHQYNLRKSRGTVDFDDSETISINSGKGKKRTSGQIMGQKATRGLPQMVEEAPGSSGFDRRRQEDSDDSEVDSDDTEAADDDTSSSSDDNKRQRFVDRIQDFLDDDIPIRIGMARSIEEPSTSGDDSSDEIVDVSYKKTQKSPNTRYVRGNKSAGESSGPDNPGKEFSQGKEVFLNSKQAGKKITERNKLGGHFSGEAGPSGKRFDDSAQSFVDKNIVIELKDDKNETADSRDKLEVKIPDAVEPCNVEMDDKDLGEASSRQNQKRTGEHNGEEEPPEKKAKTDDDWSKCYETHFVFGPKRHTSGANQSNESTNQDSQETLEPGTQSKNTQTRNIELEKRCIFTLDGTSPGISYPTTKD